MLLGNNKKQSKRAILLRASEYRHFMILRLINIIIIGAFAVAMFGLSVYIYEKIYNTIGQMQATTLLKSNLGSEIIDFNALENMEKNWAIKHSLLSTPITRNPFKPTTVIKESEREAGSTP